MCHIIPPKGRMRTKKEDWKFSINECEESIVLTVPVSKIQLELIVSLTVTFITVRWRCGERNNWAKRKSLPEKVSTAAIYMCHRKFARDKVHICGNRSNTVSV